jgi:hypothetical protein
MPDLLEAIAASDGEAVNQILTTATQQQGTGSAAEVLAPADASGATTLHLAASVGHADIVQQLLQAGAAVDAQDQRWDCPLHVAGKSHAVLHATATSCKQGCSARQLHVAGTCAILRPLHFDSNKATLPHVQRLQLLCLALTNAIITV